MNNDERKKKKESTEAYSNEDFIQPIFERGKKGEIGHY